MTAYYNEIDPFAAAWLRELMNENLIAKGDVDERDIWDVTPADVAGYKQCHFFAGIGVWSLAARGIGIPDDQPLWTGSCPCQPFSSAGKRAGFADERHLWPAFFHLIDAIRPQRIVGEQVASKDGLAWLDLVQTDMEGTDHAFGAVDTCCAGFGAPHIRQRLYWVADRGGTRLERRDEGPLGHERQAVERGDGARLMAHPDGGHSSADGGLDNATSARRNGPLESAEGNSRDEARLRLLSAGYGQNRTRRPGPTNGLWANPDWLLCRDQKWRPVEPGTFPLAHAGTFRNRIPALRGAGNAVNVAQAACFLQAVFDR